MPSDLTSNRVSSIRVDLLSAAEAPKGTLSGVAGGSVDYTANAAIKGGGNLSIVDAGQLVDFLNDRVRPVLTIDGIGAFPLGVFLFSEAPEAWDDTGRTWTGKLLDKTAVLDQDKVDATYALDAGTVNTDAVTALIASTGETSIAITPSAATLAGPLAWDPGTSKLAIVNDLLDAAGYFSLFCDGSGQYRGEPYVRPADRPIVWEFVDGANAIYLPGLVKDVDLFSIPNTVIAVGQGNATTAALVSTATNTDPSSPYSTVSRGRTIAHTETGVEAADQDTLDAYALRRLIELTSPTSSVDIQHAYVPGLTVNNAVRLRRTAAGIDARHVVTKTMISLDPTALVKTTVQQVIDL